MNRLELSIFLIVRNEADRLPRTLEAVRDLADEIILVDSGSTDETVDVARGFGAAVFVNAPFPGYGEQKRFAEAKCRNDWVLNIDADEVASAALVAELRALLSAPGDLPDGFETPIVEVLPFETVPAPFAYALHPVRLYRRSRGSYNPSPVHDRVDMAPGAKIGRLKAPLLHHSIRSIGSWTDKLLRYAAWQAEDLTARGRTIGLARLVAEFPFAFAKAYVGRRYALRGAYGFMMAMSYAFFRYMRLAKAYEAQGRLSGGDPSARTAASRAGELEEPT
jgi:glycosyltransferase involved in cell wall biosynthesis